MVADELLLDVQPPLPVPTPSPFLLHYRLMKYGPFGPGDFVIVAILNISRSLIRYNMYNSSVKDIIIDLQLEK